MAIPTGNCIERRPLASRREFFEKYAGGIGTPVIFTGVVERWPAYEKWSFEWLKDAFGSNEVLVTGGKVDKDEEYDVEVMSLADYIDALQHHADGRFYLSNYDLGAFIPSLRADFEFPRFAPSPLFERSHYWIGPAGTRTQLHCDYTQNTFAQIVGTKRFEIYSPLRSTELRGKRRGWYSSFSAVDFESELAKGGVPPAPDMDFEVSRGELLFLPYGWWHRVTCRTPSISVNQFWVNPRVALRIAPRYVPARINLAAQLAAAEAAKRLRGLSRSPVPIFRRVASSLLGWLISG